MTTSASVTTTSTSKKLQRAMSPSKRLSKQFAFVPAKTSTSTDTERDETMPPSEKEFSGTIKVSKKVPTKADLQRVADLPVLDKDGNSRTFSSLYLDPESPNEARQVLILFVRHFFCGQCQEYLRTFSSSVTPESLTSLSPPTSVVVIGCGDPSLITFYAEASSCPFPVYADPTKRLYQELGMGRTLDLGERPDYIQKPLKSVVWSSFLQTIGAGRKIFKGGDYWQVGGEFLLETQPLKGPTTEAAETRVKYCHRMTSTRDHASVPEVRRWIGLDPMPAPAITFRAPTPSPETAVQTETASKQENNNTTTTTRKSESSDTRDSSSEKEKPTIKKRWSLMAGSSDSIRRTSSELVRRSLSIGRGTSNPSSRDASPRKRWSRSRSSGERVAVKEEEEEQPTVIVSAPAPAPAVVAAGA